MPAAIPADARLILHIGAPKTGSSAVQRYCCEHADASAGQALGELVRIIGTR